MIHALSQIRAVAEEPVKITVEKGKADKVIKKAEIDQSIKLPIKKGDPVGTLTVYEGDEAKYTYELQVDRTVEKAGFITLYIRMMKTLI